MRRVFPLYSVQTFHLVVARGCPLAEAGIVQSCGITMYHHVNSGTSTICLALAGIGIVL